VSHDAKATLMAAIAAEPAPTRAQARRRDGLVLGLALAATAVLFFVRGGIRPGPHPLENELPSRTTWFMLATAGGAMLLGIGAMWGLLSRGRSMLGRSRRWLVVSVLATPLVLFAWKVLVSAQVDLMMVQWPTRLGLKCLVLGLSLGALPLAALAYTRAGTDPVHPHLSGVALGMTSGIGAWLLVDLWCPVAYIPHLLLGHVLPTVLLAVAGLGVGRWLAPRVRASRTR
jgi:hypothetical protein